MRFLLVDPSPQFLRTADRVFASTPATPHHHWAILELHPTDVRKRLPPTTVLVRPSPSPPAIFFDGVGHTITVPLFDTFSAFKISLDMLYNLASIRQVDFVAVVPFGPPTRKTAQLMRDAYSTQTLQI